MQRLGSRKWIGIFRKTDRTSIRVVMNGMKVTWHGWRGGWVRPCKASKAGINTGLYWIYRIFWGFILSIILQWKLLEDYKKGGDLAKTDGKEIRT